MHETGGNFIQQPEVTELSMEPSLINSEFLLSSLEDLYEVKENLLNEKARILALQYEPVHADNVENLEQHRAKDTLKEIDSQLAELQQVIEFKQHEPKESPITSLHNEERPLPAMNEFTLKQELQDLASQRVHMDPHSPQFQANLNRKVAIEKILDNMAPIRTPANDDIWANRS